MTNYKFWNVVLIQKGQEVLLLNRQHDDFKGYIPPGGKIEFPESFTDSAIREVKEETGLDIADLQLKIIFDYVNPAKNDHYIILHYLTKNFSGKVQTDGREGEPYWAAIDKLDELPMQPSIRLRMPYFFKDGVTEMHVVWDEENNCEKEVQIRVI